MPPDPPDPPEPSRPPGQPRNPKPHPELPVATGLAATGLVVGVGARAHTDADDIRRLIDDTLSTLGLPADAVLAMATVTARAAEPGMQAAAASYGWPLLAYPPEALRTVPIDNPSAAAQAALGTPSVAEAAALLPLPSPHGPPPTTPVLLGPRRSSHRVTVAIARHHPTAPQRHRDKPAR